MDTTAACKERQRKKISRSDEPFITTLDRIRSGQESKILQSSPAYHPGANWPNSGSVQKPHSGSDAAGQWAVRTC